MNKEALEMLRGRINRSLDLIGSASAQLSQVAPGLSRRKVRENLNDLEVELECILGRLTIAIERDNAQ